MDEGTFPALDTYELAWAAGFFDGEGNIRAKPNKQTSHIYYNPIIFMPQIDPQVLERFRHAVGGIGKVSGPYDKSHQNRQPQWYYEVYSFQGTQAVIAMLWKWLGPVKREQARVTFMTVKTRHATVQPRWVSRICVLEDCGRPYAARGLCEKHYLQQWRAQRGDSDVTVTDTTHGISLVL